MRTPSCDVRPEAHPQDALLSQGETRDGRNSLTVGQAVRVELREEVSHNPQSLGVPNQFNRESSLQELCRLASREERRERLLRVIRPHSLREYFVLKFHCLL